MVRSTEESLREHIIETCRRMNAEGLNQGTAGNVSVHTDDGLLITPSGMAYDTMRPEDIVRVDGEGRAHGKRSPSSEWRFHYDIVRSRDDVGAILHAHPTCCTALACLRRDIPAFHYMIAVAGGDSIRCAPYATFGTQELSDNALAALEGRKACLLANHGLICVDRDLESVFALAIEVETLARQYCAALQIAEPAILPAEEMRVVLAKFRSYGASGSRR